MSDKTRALVPPPRKGFLPDDLPIVQPANNMQGDRLAPMTFNMPRDWHIRFKSTAAINGMSMKDLLIASFDAWEREQREKLKG
jgi:hypothetical protein